MNAQDVKEIVGRLFIRLQTTLLVRQTTYFVCRNALSIGLSLLVLVLVQVLVSRIDISTEARWRTQGQLCEQYEVVRIYTGGVPSEGRDMHGIATCRCQIRQIRCSS
jgi:hypothetical protein